ncbi:MAG: phosphatidylserine decarboxylase [Actinobacteria bacterium]|nr:phosphatidylserine decarboxylase [Actinomycetota bacterium]
MTFRLALVVVLILSFAFYFYRKIWFYRDPSRAPDKTGNVVISPADGKVMYIKKVKDLSVSSEKLGEKIYLNEITKENINSEITDGWLVGIYMSPLDVHFNYAPLEGKVNKIVYTQAKANLPMTDMWEYFNFMILRKTVNLFAKKFHFINERNTIFLDGKDFKVIIVEIADKFVNKITPLIKEGDELEVAQKIGFIERGSQVDLIIFKEDIKFLIKTGDQVYGGKTVLAEY